MKWRPGQRDSRKAEPKEQEGKDWSKSWGEEGRYVQQQAEWQLFYPPFVSLNVMLRTFAPMVLTEGRLKFY